MSKSRLNRLFVYGAALVAFVACGVVHASTIPMSDDFEQPAYNVGDTIIGANGWMAETSSYAVVTGAMGIASFTATTLPLTNSTHDQVVSLNTEGNSISNVFDAPVGPPSVTNVYIDTMYRVVLSDTPPATITNQADVQAAFYFDTNANLVVYHSKWYSGAIYSNQFTTVAAATVATDGWARVTVSMDYLSDTFFGSPVEKYFKITIDGVDVTSAEAYNTPLKSSGLGGSWFITANRATATDFFLSSVALSGTGLFDDFVVSKDTPFYGAGQVTLTASVLPADGRGGSISPAGTIALASGSDQAFTVTESNYWSLVDVTTNSASIGTPLAFTLSNLVANVDVVADFDADLSDGVPIWWLVAYGGDTNSPGTTDSDNDGLFDDEEWLASTDAGNSNSVFEVMMIGQENGTNYIEWITDAIDPDLAATSYQIMKSTNLVEGWVPANPPTYGPRTVGTNRWMEAAPASSVVPEMFQVVAPDVP